MRSAIRIWPWRRQTLIVIMALFSSAVVPAGCEKERSWRVGERAPEITVLALNDKAVKLSDFRGKVVVLRFWETGCKGCIEGMPALDRFTRQYREKGLVVLAVNMGDPKNVVAAFVGNLHIAYPVLLDPVLIATGKYGVRASPTIFFIDRNGIARKVIIGEISQEMFDKALGELL